MTKLFIKLYLNLQFKHTTHFSDTNYKRITCMILCQFFSSLSHLASKVMEMCQVGHLETLSFRECLLFLKID